MTQTGMIIRFFEKFFFVCFIQSYPGHLQEGNLVISGGTKVFHLHPGIAPPPPANQDSQPRSAGQSAAATEPTSSQSAASLPAVTSEPAAARLFPLGDVDEEKRSQRVVEVLKSARTAQLELEMDNKEKMVLRINNEELLPILEALQKALSRVQIDHV
jgi:hypothetical protein